MIQKELLAQVKKLEIETNRIINSTVSGEYQSAFKGLGMEFQEVRPYQIGDEVKFIDWNVSARTGTPHIKVYREERELNIFLLVDLSASENFGTYGETKKALATKIAAIMALTALKNNDRVGLLIFTDKVEKFIPYKKGRSHVLRILREIMSFQPEHKQTNISRALEHINLVAKRKSVVFLISDFQDNDFKKTFEITSRKHDLVPVLIRDRFELKALPFGFLRLQNYETGATRIINTRDNDFLNKYQAKNKEHLGSLKNIFIKNTGDLIELVTGEAYLEKIVSFFKRRTLRKRY